MKFNWIKPESRTKNRFSLVIFKMKSRKCFRELQHRWHFLYVGAKHDLIQWKLLLQRKLILIKNTHEKKTYVFNYETWNWFAWMQSGRTLTPSKHSFRFIFRLSIWLRSLAFCRNSWCYAWECVVDCHQSEWHDDKTHHKRHTTQHITSIEGTKVNI